MRILHVIDYFHTDYGYQEYYLAKAQALEGHQVSVLTSSRRHSTVAVAADGGPGAAALRESGVSVLRLPSYQLGHDRAWLKGLTLSIMRFGPEIVHCHGAFSPTTLRVARACARGHFALLVDNHSSEANSPGASVASVLYRAYEKTAGPFLRSTVGTWVAVGPGEAEFLTSRLRIDERDIDLIQMGFDPEVFSFDADLRSRLRTRWGWSDDFVVVSTGKLTALKRPQAVAAACERSTRKNTRLVLAGSISPEMLGAVERAAPGLVRSERLAVWPMLSPGDLADLFLAADSALFVRPSISIFEGAGTGLEVFAGSDRYSDWLHTLNHRIIPVDVDTFDFGSTVKSDRGSDARKASDSLSWPVVSDIFVDRYRRIISSNTLRPSSWPGWSM